MNLKTGHCKGCKEEIWWFTQGNKNYPLNKKMRMVLVDIGGEAVWKSGYESHLATCPKKEIKDVNAS